MSILVKEKPAVRIEGSPRDADQVFFDDDFASSFFEFKIFMAQELSDDEVIRSAVESGAYQFLDSPEEDLYSSTD
ncbi:MAG: hypothetical protein R6V03_00995 [Kiritimatiellia bacterium]